MAISPTWYRVKEQPVSETGGYRDNAAPIDVSSERAKLLTTECRRLRENQSARRDMYQYLIEQYSCSETQNLGLTSYDASATFDAPTMPFNIVRRGVNTVYAKCAKNKPLPMVLASHGDYKVNKRARGLTNFLAGLFAHLKVPSEVSAPVCKFAEVIGTGCCYVYETPHSDFPEVYVAFPWEVWVPVSEGRNGTPRTFYMQRYVDVDRLVRQYGEKFRAEIEAAAGRDTDDTWSDESETENLVLVYYGWRLALDSESPGMYSVSIGEVELDGGEYKETYPPFAFLRYNRPLIGFWGEGLAVELVGFQYELNFTTESLRMSHRTAPTGVWVTPDPSGIPDPAFSNDIGYILKHKPGFEPKYYNPTPAPPQTYDWHDRLSEGGLRWSGISTMSANAEKPPGITAAVAMNTLDDIEADNFAVFQQDYEQFHLDLSNLLIDSMKRIAARRPDAKILVQDKRSVIEVSWKDVDMQRDAILMQTFPVALLGRTPAARRDMVAGLFKDGIIDRALYLKLLDAPDIDAEVDLDAATRTLVDDQLEKMLDAEDPSAVGVYQHPMPFTDLVYALRRATQQVCLGTLQKRPEENLALLRQYIEEAKRELKKQHADENAMNPPAPPGMPGMPPPGMGPDMGAPPGMPPGAMPPPEMPPPPGMPLPPGAAPGGIQ